MAAIKSYTNIPQSKKLAEILPIESADMGYLWNGTSFCNYPVSNQIIFKRMENVPCWSLAALLNVLPESYQLTSNKEGKVQLMLIHQLEMDYYDNPVDAVVDMIFKLKELNLL